MAAALLAAMILMPRTAAGLDPTFGGDGKVVTHLGVRGGEVAGAAIQTDGKIVVAGAFGLARLRATGELDPTFGAAGAVFPIDRDPNANTGLRGVVVQPDRKILAAGSNGFDFALVRCNEDGSFDTTFDTDGRVLTTIGQGDGPDVASAVVLQADNRIVVAGWASAAIGRRIALARYNADGSLDTSFGAGGRVLASIGQDGEATAVVLQADGKIVIAGWATWTSPNAPNANFFLARYDTNGLPDSEFGSGGVVISDFGGEEYAAALAAQADGKLVVAGNRGNGLQWLLARYSSSGALDTGFGSGGAVITSFNGTGVPSAVLVQPDQRIVAAGQSHNLPAQGRDFALARYLSNGSLDDGFGDGGKVVTNFGGSELARAVVLQSDGRLVAAGSASTTYAGLSVPALARYDNDGSLDPTFGLDGRVALQLGDSAIRALARQTDGKLLAAGRAMSPGSTGQSQGTNDNDDFAVVRYSADGSLDSGFGDGGKVVTDLDGIDQATALILQADGRIVAGGGSRSTGRGEDFALVRYETDGSLDTSFGTGGKVLTDFGGGSDSAKALALLPDGGLIAAGYGQAGTSDFALVRYGPDGALDGSFGTGGKVLTDLGGIDQATAVVVQPDGKVVAAGWSAQPYQGGGANHQFALVRYNFDGSLDSTFGIGGVVLDELGGADLASSLVLQADGKLVVAGRAVYVPGEGDASLALARYNSDGSLDGTFGQGGTVLTPHGLYDQANALVLQPDGKLVVAGRVSTGGDDDFALLRYEANGVPDESFGPGGLQLTDFSASDTANALLLLPDGRLVAGGQAGGTFALARYGRANSAPEAVDDVYSLGLSASLNVPAPGVLANDRDDDGDPLSTTLASGPSHGELTLNADGSFTYAPNPGFSGTDTFSYVVSDGPSSSNEATVTVTVPSASERIDLLITVVEGLVADDVLNGGQGHSLITKLEHARERAAEGRTAQAITMLGAFIAQVTAFVAAGILTLQEGQPLIEAAISIIGQLLAG
jgi:uncharacterized delta-60 repeat protein